MSKISDTALAGIHHGINRAADAAEKIAQATSRGDLPVDQFVELSEAKREVEANSKVIKIDQELEKSVLDILA